MNNISVTQPETDKQSYPVIVYQPEGSALEIQLSADPEEHTIWATQKQIALALGITIPSVNSQIANFKAQRTNSASRDIRQYLITASDGKSYLVEHYNLTVITFVGFRAKATEQVIRFQDWVGKELDRIVSEKRKTLTPAELILAQAKQLVEHEQVIRELAQRQDNHEDRLSRVEARQTAIIDDGSQYMSIGAYCLWKNIDTKIYNPQHLPALIDKATILSQDMHYNIGKAIALHGYEDTFHLDFLNELLLP